MVILVLKTLIMIQEKSVKFDAIIEIIPQIDLVDISSLNFTKEAITLEEQEVEKTIKGMLESKATMVEEKDESTSLQNGLFAVFNFEGEKENGERPPEMKADEHLLEIGSGQFIPGFEEGMIGMKKGEKKIIELTFPADYHAEDLKDAKVKFHVELLEIKKKDLPDLDEEMAKEFGHDSVDDLKEKTKKRILDQKERESTRKLNQEIVEKLVEMHDFDLPLALIAQQEESLKQEVRQTLQQQNAGIQEEEYFEKWKDDLRQKAVFQVRSGLILDGLAQKYEIEATEEDFDQKLQEVADSSNLDVEQIKGFYQNDPKVKSNLMYSIREEKTFQKITEVIGI